MGDASASPPAGMASGWDTGAAGAVLSIIDAARECDVADLAAAAACPPPPGECLDVCVDAVASARVRVRAAALAAECDALRARARDADARAAEAAAALAAARGAADEGAVRDARAAAEREAALSATVDRQRRALADLGAAASALAHEHAAATAALVRLQARVDADAEERRALAARAAGLQELYARALAAPGTRTVLGPPPATDADVWDAAVAAAMLAVAPGDDGKGGDVEASWAAAGVALGPGGRPPLGGPPAARAALSQIEALLRDKGRLEAINRELEDKLEAALADARDTRAALAAERRGAADGGARARSALAAAARRADAQAKALADRDAALADARRYVAKLEARLLEQHRAAEGARRCVPRSHAGAARALGDCSAHPGRAALPSAPGTAGRLSACSGLRERPGPASAAAAAAPAPSHTAPPALAEPSLSSTMDDLEARLTALARALDATPGTRATLRRAGHDAEAAAGTPPDSGKPAPPSGPRIAVYAHAGPTGDAARTLVFQSPQAAE